MEAEDMEVSDDDYEEEEEEEEEEVKEKKKKFKKKCKRRQVFYLSCIYRNQNKLNNLIEKCANRKCIISSLLIIKYLEANLKKLCSLSLFRYNSLRRTNLYNFKFNNENTIKEKE